MSLLGRLRGLDSFAKTRDDYRTKTVFGGLVTLLSTLTIGVLIFAEVVNYNRVFWKSELVVDQSGISQMDVNFDIAFPKVPCFALTLDVMDAADRHQNNIETDVLKIRMDESGKELDRYVDVHLDELMGNNYCGKCHNLNVVDQMGKQVCCNSCSSVFAAHEHMGMPPPPIEEIEQCILENWPDLIKNHAKEGCRMKGTFRVNRLSGNFHFALGKSFDFRGNHIHDVRFLQGLQLDFSHHIHTLSFGERQGTIVNPLDNTNRMVPEHKTDAALKTHAYHLKIVGTDFRFLTGKCDRTNQFTVSYSDQDSPNEVPSLFFFYDISPMLVVNSEQSRSWISFLTSVLAIIGGVYTIAALIDTLVFNAERRMAEKLGLGKVS